MDAAALAARLAALTGAAVPARAPGAAVVILVRLANVGLEVLLMRRAERAGDRWSGQIALPGGHAGPDDPDLLATACRETREEVGLDPAHEAELLGRLAPVQAKARGQLLALWITPFVFLARDGLVPTPGPEAQEVFWFPLERARAGQLAWTHRYMRGAEERVLPAWCFEERVVWGLTYEILSTFLGVLP